MVSPQVSIVSWAAQGARSRRSGLRWHGGGHVPNGPFSRTIARFSTTRRTPPSHIRHQHQAGRAARSATGPPPAPRSKARTAPPRSAPNPDAASRRTARSIPRSADAFSCEQHQHAPPHPPSSAPPARPARRTAPPARRSASTPARTASPAAATTASPAHSTTARSASHSPPAAATPHGRQPPPPAPATTSLATPLHQARASPTSCARSLKKIRTCAIGSRFGSASCSCSSPRSGAARPCPGTSSTNFSRRLSLEYQKACMIPRIQNTRPCAFMNRCPRMLQADAHVARSPCSFVHRLRRQPPADHCVVDPLARRRRHHTGRVPRQHHVPSVIPLLHRPHRDRRTLAPHRPHPVQPRRPPQRLHRRPQPESLFRRPGSNARHLEPCGKIHA